MENGEWRMEDGKWRMEDGGWKMENGGWKMENGGWKMEKRETMFAHGCCPVNALLRLKRERAVGAAQ